MGTTQILCLVALAALGSVHACTNFLISRGASADGSTVFSYAADSGSLYGTLGHYPAADHPAGTMRSIYDWDSGVYLGQIPEANHTYNVIGNMNEFQLAIGESTFGGLPQLSGQKATMDYGSLIWVTLQRTRNAREAIEMMGALVAEYGYASEGESFTIADPNEIWILEMIGKGPARKGAVWVAVRIPDGYVSGHANQARIRTFPLNDPANCVYSSDVVQFAVDIGLYPSTAPASAFSFSDIYDPVTFTGARACELRVWDFFRRVAADPNFGNTYEDYVSGRNLTHRMPLWIQPARPISVNDTMWLMRSHYEGTNFDMRVDVGAGAYNAAFRPRPISWSVNGKSYFNERPVGTEQTGWHFVAQLRSWLPNPVGGLLWFGVDDVSQSVHVPMYCCSTRSPAAWHDGNGDALTFTFKSAFWVYNLVANFVYQRYSTIHPDVAARIVATEARYFSETASIDQAATDMFNNDPATAVEYLSNYSEETANTNVEDWLTFFQVLFVKYRDGFTVTRPASPVPDHGGAQGGVVPDAASPGITNSSWLARIVAETGDHYLVPASTEKQKILEERKTLLLQRR